MKTKLLIAASMFLVIITWTRQSLACDITPTPTQTSTLAPTETVIPTETMISTNTETETPTAIPDPIETVTFTASVTEDAPTIAPTGTNIPVETLMPPEQPVETRVILLAVTGKSSTAPVLGLLLVLAGVGLIFLWRRRRNE